MTEFASRPPESLIEMVRTSENTKEENWREIFLAENLFHAEHLDEVFNRSPEDRILLMQLENEFLNEKRGKNMGERFALALDEKYLGKIHIVELGHTTDPGRNGEIDGLKDEYRDLLKWMIENGIVEHELTRQESGRRVSIRKPVTPEAASSLGIVVRNRPLIDTAIEHEGETLDVAIGKRMVFSLPQPAIKALLALSDDINCEQTQQYIEERFLRDGWGGVAPIRTSYYLATKLR